MYVASFPGFPLEKVESLGDYRTRATWGRRKGRNDLMGRGGKPMHWSAYVTFSLGLWISSEDGTRGSAEVRVNVSSEPVFVYTR